MLKREQHYLDILFGRTAPSTLELMRCTRSNGRAQPLHSVTEAVAEQRENDSLLKLNSSPTAGTTLGYKHTTKFKLNRSAAKREN